MAKILVPCLLGVGNNPKHNNQHVIENDLRWVISNVPNWLQKIASTVHRTCPQLLTGSVPNCSRKVPPTAHRKCPLVKSSITELSSQTVTVNDDVIEKRQDRDAPQPTHIMA